MNEGFEPRSGAFEIVADNKLLWSKVATGKFPSAPDAVELVTKFKADPNQFAAAPEVDRTARSSGCSIQ